MGKTKRESVKRARDERRSENGRALRLQELIREEVNFLLRNDITDVRLDSVVITHVELAADGSCARLWFTAEGEQDRAKALDRASGYFRSHIRDSLALKRTPELRFRRDPTSRTFMEMAQLPHASAQGER